MAIDLKKRKIEDGEILKIVKEQNYEPFHGLFRLFDKDKHGEIIRLYPCFEYKYDGNSENAQNIYNKINGNLDNLKTLNYETYKYFDYGHISNLFDKMKSNKDDLLCFEVPVKYLCTDELSTFSSTYIISGNLLFLDFNKDVIIQSGNIEYQLSKNDGFPIYSIHFMTSGMKYYDKNLIVKCWMASNAFYNLFVTNTKVHKTNKFKCYSSLVAPLED